MGRRTTQGAVGSTALTAGVLALVACGAGWWFMSQLSSHHEVAAVPDTAVSGEGEAKACCTVAGPWNINRVEDAGPDDAPVHVVGLAGNCWDQKLAVDMLVELASEYPEHLRITVRNFESDEAKDWGTPCASYMIKADGYTPVERPEVRDGFYLLFEKSPPQGGWTVGELEAAVRAALEACGAEPHDRNIAGEIGAPSVYEL